MKNEIFLNIFLVLLSLFFYYVTKHYRKMSEVLKTLYWMTGGILCWVAGVLQFWNFSFNNQNIYVDWIGYVLFFIGIGLLMPKLKIKKEVNNKNERKKKGI